MNLRSGFVRSDDGTDLYWRAVGEGPLMICCNGVGVSTFFWRYLIENFRDQFTVVVWDYREHGRSQRARNAHQTDLSIHRHASDLQSIIGALNESGEPVILVGHSMGCQVIFEHHRRHPTQTRALIPMLGTAGSALKSFGGWDGSVVAFRVIRKVIMKLGPLSGELIRPALHSPLPWRVTKALRLMDPMYARREDLQHYVEHMASIDPRVFIESVWQLNQHDVWDTLPDIQSPTLIIAAENDTFTPIHCSRKMAETIPNAELLILADASHAALIEQPETIHHRMERFFRERLSEMAN